MARSEYVQSATTIIVGLFAYVIYRLKLRDNKRNAAKIVNVELSGAEDRLEQLKERFAESDGKDIGTHPILASNSWGKYKHLFIKDFTDKQWRKVGEFYENCESLNKAIEENMSFFGQNSQAIRTERYKAASQFVRSAVQAIERGDFNVKQADGTQTVAPDAYSQAGKLVEAELVTFNSILEESLNASGTHYNPLKPINDTNTLLKHMDTEILDGEIGIKLRKIANRKL